MEDGCIDIEFDGNDLIEIACSYPDIKTAMKALNEGLDN